jgi:uroporphyrinogen-III synthase
MAPAEGNSLTGLTVLVTRPEYQQTQLVDLIERENGNAFRFPTLAIAPTDKPDVLLQTLASLGNYDIAIFVSPNAASYTFRALLEAGLALPASLKIGCVGKGCAEAVRQYGRTVDALPLHGIGSEGLIQHGLLRQVSNKRVVIFRGNGGRDLLSDTLRQRGATVDYCECYQRVVPGTDPTPLIARWQQGGIDLVTITSTQALQNLRTLLGKYADALLADTPMVVISDRIAASAKLSGVNTVLVTEDTGDQAIVDCIKRWRTGQIPI